MQLCIKKLVIFWRWFLNKMQRSRQPLHLSLLIHNDKLNEMEYPITLNTSQKITNFLYRIINTEREREMQRGSRDKNPVFWQEGRLRSHRSSVSGAEMEVAQRASHTWWASSGSSFLFLWPKLGSSPSLCFWDQPGSVPLQLMENCTYSLCSAHHLFCCLHVHSRPAGLGAPKGFPISPQEHCNCKASHSTQLYVSAKDLNKGPHTCVDSTSSAEPPPPQHCLSFLLPFSPIVNT